MITRLTHHKRDCKVTPTADGSRNNEMAIISDLGISRRLARVLALGPNESKQQRLFSTASKDDAKQAHASHAAAHNPNQSMKKEHLDEVISLPT